MNLETIANITVITCILLEIPLCLLYRREIKKEKKEDSGDAVWKNFLNRTNELIHQLDHCPDVKSGQRILYAIDKNAEGYLESQKDNDE